MLQIRTATLTHAHDMASIHAAAFPHPETWNENVLRLQLDLPGAFGLINANNGFLLARLAGDEAEILTLAVAPAARRRGIGTALLAAAQARAAVEGAAAMFLEVSTRNHAAIGLYHSLGFQEVGRRPAYYTSGEDALVLKAPLKAVSDSSTASPQQ